MAEAILAFSSANGGYIGKDIQSIPITFTLALSQSSSSSLGYANHELYTLTGLTGAINCTVTLPTIKFTGTVNGSSKSDNAGAVSIHYRILNGNENLYGSYGDDLYGSCGSTVTGSIPSTILSLTPQSDSITIYIRAQMRCDADSDYYQSASFNASSATTISIIVSTVRI